MPGLHFYVKIVCIVFEILWYALKSEIEMEKYKLHKIERQCHHCN